MNLKQQLAILAQVDRILALSGKPAVPSSQLILLRLQRQELAARLVAAAKQSLRARAGQ